jgi:hypothetical protein
VPPNAAEQLALHKQPTRCVGGKLKKEYLPACHECAKQLKPGEERSDCVFEDFRLLQHHKVTGELYEVTAESTATAVADDVAPMERTTADYLISHAAPALITVLDRELTFLKTLATPRVEPRVRERGRGYRELCDVCLTSIFNLRCAWAAHARCRPTHTHTHTHTHAHTRTHTHAPTYTLE